MLYYLTILSAFGSFLASLILIGFVVKKDFNEAKKYFSIGLIGAFIDFVFEYLGTSVGHWSYNESVYFIFNLIPIELVFLFFSGSIIAMFLFLNLNKIRNPIKPDVILYALILIAFVFYLREIYQESFADILPLSILIGLWGISNISSKNRTNALLIALVAVVLDLLVELVIIGSGSYSYRNGFYFGIPMSYGLFVLGILGTVEKIQKFDWSSNYPFIRKLLKLFGLSKRKK